MGLVFRRSRKQGSLWRENCHSGNKNHPGNQQRLVRGYSRQQGAAFVSRRFGVLGLLTQECLGQSEDSYAPQTQQTLNTGSSLKGFLRDQTFSQGNWRNVRTIHC